MTGDPGYSRRVALLGNQAFSILNFRGHLIRELVRRGFEVYALAPDYTDETRRELEDLGARPVDIKMSRTGLNPILDLFALVQLTLTLRELDSRSFLAFAAKPVIYGTIAAWLAGIPNRFAMVEGLGYVFIGNGAKQRLLRPLVTTLYRLALGRARKVFILNDDDVADFKRWRLIRNDQIERIDGIGLDLDAWPPAPTVADPVTFLFVGRLIRDKGISEFIEAARRLKRRHPDCRFVVLGNVDANPKSVSEDEARTWVTEGLVEWPGQVKVRPWMEKASVFVLPSYREGLPRSTQEAMAMARPVITTDVPGCRDTVIDSINGFLVPPRDSQAIADAMARFVEHPELIATMGEESRKAAEARFDVHKINDRILSIMQLRHENSDKRT
jgi:glycosyltransferase involved in cell wall biosynthesis